MIRAAAARVRPKVMVFDLDGCVWSPEMYELWGGGTPFTSHDEGLYLSDRRGVKVELLGDVRNILNELKTSEKWSSTCVAVASSCDEPSWARECINKFSIGDGFMIKDIFSEKRMEIYKATSKQVHFKAIQKKCSNIPFEEMMFFDNEMRNCTAVAKLGVTVVYTPDGVTRKSLEEALDKYPAPGEIIGPKDRGPLW